MKERLTLQIILLCVPEQAFRECRSGNIVINLNISGSLNKHLGNVPLGNIVINLNISGSLNKHLGNVPLGNIVFNLNISRLQGVGGRGFLKLLIYRLKIYV